MRTPSRPVRPSSSRHPAAGSRRRAFTLVELLVVIGIIVVLMAILIPAVGRVQTQARIADTRNQMLKIVSALERYHSDQHAYPGPFPNSVFTPAGTPITMTQISGGVTAPGPLTMSENLLLGLAGGWDVVPSTTPGPPNGVCLEASIGKGPMVFAPNPSKRKRITPPYLEPTPGQMTAVVNQANSWGENALVGTMDSWVPEPIDRFQNPRPILYVRANVGAPGGVDVGYSSGTWQNYQYSTGWLQTYLNPAIGQKTASGDWVLDPDLWDFNTTQPNAKGEQPRMLRDFPDKTIGSVTIPAGWQSYLANPSVPGVPRGKDAFILISAGADGAYGTKDDIIYP